MLPSSILCTKNHSIKDIWFCKRCAGDYPSIIQSLDRVFFCRECNPAALGQHQHLQDRYSILQDKFKGSYKEFRQDIQMKNDMMFIRYIEKASAPKNLSKQQVYAKIGEIIRKNPPFYVLALNSNPITLNDLLNEEYRKWLVKSHFWEKPYGSQIESQIQEYVKNQFKSAPKDPWDNFKIQFNKSVNAAVDLSKQIQESKNRLIDLDREKVLSELFVQITTCFSKDDIQTALNQFKKIQGDCAANFPFLLKLGKLKVLQLHEKGSQEMKKILNQIKLNTLYPRQQQLYYYYSAISQWKFVQDPEDEQYTIFLDSRNRNHFKLEDSRKFIDFLNKAIQISKKPLYLATRGLGYIVLGQYDRAQADFNQAKQLSYSSDAMQNNQLYTRIKRSLQVQKIRNEDLLEKKTDFIMNICKYLQKSKRYKQLRVCGQVLVNRQPQNISFRVNLLKALLKLKDTDAARQQLSEIKDLKELLTEEIEEFQRKIQLIKAQEQDQLGNLSDAEGKFEHAANVGKPSASYWYNYAVFLFKHRDERQRNEKALIAINNALEIKEKPQYMQLKYMLLFLLGNMEEAKKIQYILTDSKFESMREYVDENI